MPEENSEQLSVSIGATVRANEPSGSLVAFSMDEPIDEALLQPYAIDGINLLVHSPTKLFLCWNHAHDPSDTLRKAFYSEAAQYHLTVRLVDVDSGYESFHEASATRMQWFDVSPGRAYKAHIGFFASGRPFIHLFTSGTVRTPRPSVSSATDAADHFKVPTMSFVHMLNEAGYVSDAMEVALEAS
ncbi:MAG: DUF4912 domain-containing protein [Pyrinomonadaceae bacterium]|nr:DUF4912 domain-containing protein [Pyrinomonadaceae bacterium]